MTALDPTAWFHYFSEDQLVLVSPALANLDAPDRDVYSASALARPALGLLPPHVRYILAKDESLRLEFVMNAHSDNAEKHAPVPVLPPESLCPTANELAILDSEREALAGRGRCLEPVRRAKKKAQDKRVGLGCTGSSLFSMNGDPHAKEGISPRFLEDVITSGRLTSCPLPRA